MRRDIEVNARHLYQSTLTEPVSIRTWERELRKDWQFLKDHVEWNLLWKDIAPISQTLSVLERFVVIVILCAVEVSGARIRRRTTSATSPDRSTENAGPSPIAR